MDDRDQDLECYEYYCAGAELEKSAPLKALECYKKALLVNERSIEAHRAIARLCMPDPMWFKRDDTRRTALQAALHHSCEILKIDPTDYGANMACGIADVDNGQWEDGLHHFGVAVQQRPTDPVAHYNVACACWALELKEKAVTHYQAALFLQPRFEDAHFNLGNCFLELNQPDEAVFHYGQVIALREDRADALSNLGKAFCFAQGDSGQGIARLEQAIKLRDTMEWPRITKGAALLQMGSVEEARKEFMCVYRQPMERAGVLTGDPELEFVLGVVYSLLNQHDAAEKHFKHCVGLDPQNARAYCSLGMICQQRKRMDQAAEHYALALQTAPEDPEVLCNLGLALEEQDRFSEAIARYKEAVKLEPSCTTGYFGLGNNMERSGRAQEAVEAYQQVLELDPLHSDAHFKLGGLFLQRQEEEAAEKHLMLAIQLNPIDSEARLLLIRLYLAREQLEDAEEHCDALMEQGVQEATLLKAVICDKQDFVQEAIEHYTAVMKAVGRRPEYLAKLARLQGRNGAFKQALKLVDEARKGAPSDKELMMLRAGILLELGRLDEAMAVLQSAASEDQTVGFELYFQMGVCNQAKAKALAAEMEDGWEELFEAERQAALKHYRRASDLQDDLECLTAQGSLVRKLWTERLQHVREEQRRLRHQVINVDAPEDKTALLVQAQELMQDALPELDQQAAEYTSCFKRAVAEDGDDWLAQYNYANALAGLQKGVQASMRMKKALELLLLNPAQLPPKQLLDLEIKMRLEMGLIYQQCLDDDKARAEWEKVAYLNPDEKWCYFHLGNLELKKMALDEAIGCFKEVLRADVDEAEAHFRKGLAHKAKGEWELVLEEMKETLRIDTDYPSAHFMLGFSHMMMADAASASNSLATQLKYEPRHLGANYYLGTQLYALGDKVGAVAKFKQTQEIDPTFFKPLYDMSLILQQENNREGASELLKQVLYYEPCHKRALNNLGLIKDLEGESEEAAKLYQEAIRLDPNHSDALNNLGTNLNAKGLQDDAIAHFNRAIKVDANAIAPHYNMAIALTKLDRRDDAIRHYQEVLVIDPSETDAHFLLANAYDAQGKSDRSREHRRLLANATKHK